MTTKNKQGLKVLIIGASLGGLALAHALKKIPGIDVHVFEQDSEDDGKEINEKINSYIY
jgi:2-polyprenyl-6-methoxyphenol hydroxylase-like FAD-dependent oxidoreductase